MFYAYILRSEQNPDLLHHVPTADLNLKSPSIKTIAPAHCRSFQPTTRGPPHKKNRRPQTEDGDPKSSINLTSP
jgi:hypothetical protein